MGGGGELLSRRHRPASSLETPPWTKDEEDAYLNAQSAPAGRVPRKILSRCQHAAAIINRRFYFARGVSSPAQFLSDEIWPFATDDTFYYEPYSNDFGPLNLGHVNRYCTFLSKALQEPELAKKKIVHCCGHDEGMAENAAFLIGAFCILILKMPPKQAIIPFTRIGTLTAFRDASCGYTTYSLRLYTCLSALHHAASLGWYSQQTFDVQEYEKYEKVAEGDFNWIIPKKVLAFSGPLDPTPLNPKPINPPEKYIPIFQKMGVKMIIRLNNRQYSRKAFVRAGFKHVDLYFMDGSCPSQEIVTAFLAHCEQESGAIAVHCKAGLGRTGTLIGCYAMKHYGFEPGQWIAWNRICRPGSVLGPQQHFLHCVKAEGWLVKKSTTLPLPRLTSETRAQSSSDEETTPWVQRAPSPLSAKECKVAVKGEKGQGERLVLAKHRPLLRLDFSLNQRPEYEAQYQYVKDSSPKKSGSSPTASPTTTTSSAASPTSSPLSTAAGRAAARIAQIFSGGSKRTDAGSASAGGSLKNIQGQSPPATGASPTTGARLVPRASAS